MVAWLNEKPAHGNTRRVTDGGGRAEGVQAVNSGVPHVDPARTDREMGHLSAVNSWDLGLLIELSIEYPIETPIEISIEISIELAINVRNYDPHQMTTDGFGSECADDSQGQEE